MVGRVEAVKADSTFWGFSADPVDVVPGAGVVDVALDATAELVAGLGCGVAGVIIYV